MTQVPLILPQSISAIGAFTALNNPYLDNGLADYLAIDPSACTGLGDAPLRTTAFPAAGEDGVNIFAPKDDALIMSIVGDLIVTSTGPSNEPGYFPAVVALYQELKTAIDALKAAPASLVHSAGSMKVWKQSEIDPTFTSYWTIRVTFSLIQDVFAA